MVASGVSLRIQEVDPVVCGMAALTECGTPSCMIVDVGTDNDTLLVDQFTLCPVLINETVTQDLPSVIPMDRSVVPTCSSEGMEISCTTETLLVISTRITPTSQVTSTIIARSMTADSLTVSVSNSTTVVYDSEGQPGLTDDEKCKLGYCAYCSRWANYGNCRVNNYGLLKSLGVVTVTLLSLVLAFMIMLVVCCRCGVRRIFCCCCDRCTVQNTTIYNGLMNSNMVQMENMVERVEQTEVRLLRAQLAAAEERERQLQSSTVNLELEDGDGLTGSTEVEKPVEFATVRPTTKRTVLPPMYLVMALCCLCLAGFASAACTGMVTSMTGIPYCVRYNLTHQTCSTRVTVSSTMTSNGAQTCMDIVSDGVKIGTVNITLSRVNLKTNLVKQYYTSDWNMLVQSNRRCRGASGAQCNRYSSPKGCSNCQQMNPCGQLSGGEIMNWPGVSGCLDGPTCSCAAGSGNACQNYRWAIKPFGDPYKVLSPTSTVWDVGFTVEAKTANWTYSKTFTMSNPSFVDSDMSGVITGLFSQITPNFDTRSVVTNENTGVARLINANLPQVPVANAVGDIQSGELAGLTTPSTSAFIYATNLISLQAQCDGLSYQVAQPSIRTWSNAPTFPMVWAGYTQTYSNGFLTAPVTGSLSASVSLAFNKNVSFVVLLDAIVPTSLTFKSLEGCFACPMGANVSVCASVSRPGQCVLSFNNATVVSGQRTFTNDQVACFNVTGDFSTRQVSEMLTMSCNGGEISTIVAGTLSDWNDLNPIAPTTNHYDQPTGSGFGISLGGFNALATWAKSLIIAGIIVGVVILIICLLPVLVRCGSCKDKSYTEKVRMVLKKPKKNHEETPLTSDQDD